MLPAAHISAKSQVRAQTRAFSPHLTAVTMGRIDQTRKPADRPDPNEELLAKVIFFAKAEVAELQRQGKLYDAYTLSALASICSSNPIS